VAYQPLPPPLPAAQAEALGIALVGTCDWGGCNREQWGARWDRDTRQYLTVCEKCRRGAGTVRPRR
jgi:hypothetical protein